jgi:predicted nucleotidyltransferase
VKTLRNANFSVIVNRGDFLDPIQSVVCVQDKFHNRVDLIIGTKGMTEDVFGCIQTVKFFGVKINIVSPEDLIAMKMFAGSDKDILDAENVFRVSGESIDRKLVKKLVDQYGKDAITQWYKLVRRL